MSIRKINSEDLRSVSSICIDAFMGAVAPTLEEEGIQTFQSIASISSLESRMEADNEMLVYEENHQVVGFLELKEGRHIAMLFVSPNSQKNGVGKSLISEILTSAKSDVITVSASLTSVPAYLHYGFECAGDVAESSGLKYQPMQIELSKSKHAVLQILSLF
jgi:N-acetylglutamate synthase-like GNAT family acetyltransferase